MPTFVVNVTLSGFYQSSRRIRPTAEAAALEGARHPLPPVKLGHGFVGTGIRYSPGAWEPTGLWEQLFSGADLLGTIDCERTFVVEAESEDKAQIFIEDSIDPSIVFPGIPNWKFLMPLATFKFEDADHEDDNGYAAAVSSAPS